MGDASIVGSKWRNVEVGRVVVLNDNGPFHGHLATIVEVIDYKRVLVHGPSEDAKLAVPRQQVSLANCLIAPLAIENMPRGMREGTVKKWWAKAKMDDQWKESNWSKKRAKQDKRQALTDFDRFKVLRLKKQRRFEESKALAKIKASA